MIESRVSLARLLIYKTYSPSPFFSKNSVFRSSSVFQLVIKNRDVDIFIVDLVKDVPFT